jgi:uncharacterized protein YyaL (SSP411 family)
MEQESFSDSHVAEILNKNFISIKVDREERPDLDHVYMTALQMMTGHGGWPLNIFLTPDLRPFFGGTYFAPDSRYGRPPFRELLLKIIDVFQNQQDLVQKNADQLTAMLAQGQIFDRREIVDGSLKEKVLENLKRSYDSKGGGLGQAPKFFHTDGLRILLRESVDSADAKALEMVEHSLSQMAIGGVFDQLGGGFHRYSTDADWHVPHFEKMLYDNALLSVLYLEVYKRTQNCTYREIVCQTLNWVLREMTSDTGVFYSSIDADSEHHEGKFYLWTWQEIVSMSLGTDLDEFVRLYNVSEAGNFEGKNILRLKQFLTPSEKSRMRPILQELLEVRNKRQKPSVDKKTMTSWNGLMISALAKAGSALNEPRYLDAAIRAADQIWKAAASGSKLSHLFDEDFVGSEDFLEDYAYFGESLLDLFESTLNTEYLKRAELLAERILSEFYDPNEGGFFAIPRGRIDVLVRYKEVFDGALPSPYAVVLSMLSRLMDLTGDQRWKEPLDRSIQAIFQTVLDSPGGAHRLTLVTDEYLRGAELFIGVQLSSEEESKLRLEFRSRRHLFLWTRRADLESVCVFKGKWSAESKRYICEGGSCREL